MLRSENSVLIDHALEYARKNLNNTKISVEDVALHAGFTANYFNQVFAAHTGFSVMEYIRFERLRKAASQLQATDKDILEIALDNGYETHEGFSRSFKQQYGCTPSEFREKKKGFHLCWKDMADPTVAKRFLADHPGFRPADEQILIDELLLKDPHRYGYLCVSINTMALKAVTDLDDPVKGFVLVGDTASPDHPYEVRLVCDDKDTVARWLKSVNCVTVIYTDAEDAVPDHASVKKEYMYLGNPEVVSLQEGMIIRPLTSKDHDQIRQLAGSRNNGLIHHLLHLEQSEKDEGTLEYGVFTDHLLAVAVCAPERVHGFVLNDCIMILFPEGEEDSNLYRIIYRWVTSQVAKEGLIPFDDIQQGEYAKANGGFCSADVGYQFVNRVYRLEN